MSVLFGKDTIAIYNHYYTDTDKYKRTNLSGVNWQSKRNATVGDKGVNVADSTIIFINKSTNYVTPKAFQQLLNKGDKFTFNIGDKVVKGNIVMEVTKIADLEKTYDNVVTIMAIRECSGHWEVEAK